MHNHTPPDKSSPVASVCCDPKQAASWLDALTKMALAGDADARRALPEAVDHYLAAHRQIGVPR